MRKFLKKAVTGLFPELSGGLHLDRYGRVLAVADAPGTGAASERFRPRLAVDIEILTPDMEPDPAFPKYTALPLPVPMGAGGEAGVFAFPRPGALVIVGFAYGRQDHPVIRQIYSMGDSLPEVGPDEMLLQQKPTVFQRADAGGNWSRETDAEIADKSVSRRVEAISSETSLGSEKKLVSEHSHTEVDGAKTVEVGTQLTMLAGTRADLGTLGALNLTAGGNSTHSTAKDAAETVGGNHQSRVGGDRGVKIAGRRDEEVGGENKETSGGDKIIEAANIYLKAQGIVEILSATGNTSLLGELSAALGDIKAALDVLAAHTHPSTGVISQGGAVAGHSASLGGHKGRMDRISR